MNAELIAEREKWDKDPRYSTLYHTDSKGNRVAMNTTERSSTINRWAESAIKVRKESSRTTKRIAMAEYWKDQPDFIRGPFHGEFEDIEYLLNHRDDDAAHQLAKHLHAPATYSIAEKKALRAVAKKLAADILALNNKP